MTETIEATAEVQAPVTEAIVTAPTVDFGKFVEVAPPELKELFNKNGVKDFDTLNKSYAGLNTLLGKKGLIKPDENASEAEKAEYQKKLNAEIGVPENGEYEFVLPEGFTEDADTQGFLDKMAGAAHKAGMSQAAYQNMVDFVLTEYRAMTTGTQDFQALKEAWGKDFDNNLRQASEFYSKVMKGNPLGEKLNAQFGNDPAFIAFAHQLAGKLGEDSLVAGKPSASMGKEELQKQALAKTQEAMKANSEGRYADVERLQKEAQELYARAI